MPPPLPVEVRLSRGLLILLYLGVFVAAAASFALSSLPAELVDWGTAWTEGIRSAW